MLVRGKCRTNLDDYRMANWPTVFAKVPDVGDRVKSDGGKVLWVCGITHAMTTINDMHGLHEEPFIELELHGLNSVPIRGGHLG